MSQPRRIVAIVPAGGCGRRFGGDSNKLFALLDGQPLWVHTARTLLEHPDVTECIMPVAEGDESQFQAQAFQHELTAEATRKSLRFVRGGSDRTASVAAGLAAVVDDCCNYVAIHDAARPLVHHQDLTNVFNRAQETGAAMLATPVSGTLKRVQDGQVTATVPRQQIWVALTPQVFELSILRDAYARHRGRAATDDAELVERAGGEVAIVPGSPDNIKITVPEDLAIAEAMLQARNTRVAETMEAD
ncbi:MAG: 2-C-methyl-D-erythritol 4-phosphate cytidylyltransferase [Planctomycetota bacterium]